MENQKSQQKKEGLGTNNIIPVCNAVYNFAYEPGSGEDVSICYDDFEKNTDPLQNSGARYQSLRKKYKKNIDTEDKIEAKVAMLKAEQGQNPNTFKELNNLIRDMKDENEQFLEWLKDRYGKDMKFLIPDPSKDIKLEIKFDINKNNYMETTTFLPNTQELVNWIESNFNFDKAERRIDMEELMKRMEKNSSVYKVNNDDSSQSGDVEKSGSDAVNGE